MNNKSIVKAAMALVAVFASVTAVANHKDGHTSEGVGQIDTAQYNCNGLGATECMLMKLDRIERKIGCPLEDYLDDSCPYSPVDTTATFCISQGREGGIGAGWSVIPYMEGELGVGWPSVGWGKLTAKVENPLFLGPFPIPTELTIAGSASLGRNLNICIDVPLLAADHIAGGETISDEEMIDRIVRNINTPAFDGPMSRSKFQRRLSRLANYAIARVPGTNRFEFSTQQAHMTGLARVMDDDGESEFDALENAIEWFWKYRILYNKSLMIRTWFWGWCSPLLPGIVHPPQRALPDFRRYPRPQRFATHSDSIPKYVPAFRASTNSAVCSHSYQVSIRSPGFSELSI